MMRLEFTRATPAEAWDQRVRSCAGGTLFQTTHWARFCSRYFGVEPLYLLARDASDQVQGQLLFFNEPVGYRSVAVERPLARLTAPLMRRLVPSYRWQHGPLIFAENEGRSAVCEDMLRQVHAFAAARGGTSIEPSTPPMHGCDPHELRVAFAAAGYSCRTWSTFLIDLQAEPDALWARLDRAARKAVRRTQDHGVSVQRVGDLEQLHDYYDFAVQQFQ